MTWASLPMSTTLSVESLELPARERMGLAGGSLLFEAAPGWWAGPGVYGAATGRRAGLFVGGLEVQRRVRLGTSSQLAAGLYLGGGGGGAAPVGDGLLVRPSATLLWELGGWHAGLALSGARFSGTQVGGAQLAFVLAWDGRYRHAAPGQAGRLLADAQGSGLAFEELQIALSRWSLRDGSGREAGLASARLIRSLRPGSSWTVGAEMGAAATGGFAGYMEILGSLGLQQQLGPDWRVGSRLALGLGGGGALSDGGGGLVKASAYTSWQALPGWTIGLEAGAVRPASGTLPRARSVQAWVSHALQPVARTPGVAAPGRLADLEWTAGVQRMQRAARRDGRPSGPIDLVTGKLDRQLSPHLYRSAQPSPPDCSVRGWPPRPKLDVGAWASKPSPALRAAPLSPPEAAPSARCWHGAVGPRAMRATRGSGSAGSVRFNQAAP